MLLAVEQGAMEDKLENCPEGYSDLRQGWRAAADPTDSWGKG